MAGSRTSPSPRYCGGPRGAGGPRTPRSKPTSRGPSSCSGDTPPPSRGCSASCSAPRLVGGDCAKQPEHAHQLRQAYFLLRGDCPRAVAEAHARIGGALERK